MVQEQNILHSKIEEADKILREELRIFKKYIVSEF